MHNNRKRKDWQDHVNRTAFIFKRMIKVMDNNEKDFEIISR